MIRKFISELVGTMLLVFFGCGTAVAVTSYLQPVFSSTAVIPYSLIAVSLAFGLILIALIAMIGKVSGCHVNPAVSIAHVITGRMSLFDCVYYVVAQIVGGIAGAALLAMIMGSTASLGANFFEASQAISLGAMVTAQKALMIEIILTFTFVLTVLAATKKENCNSGLVIGLTLTLVHLMGMVFTGTSVNPARSIGPALLTGETAMSQLWVFIVGPLVGGILAALFHRLVLDPKEEELVYANEVEEEMIEEPVVEEVEEVVEEKPKKEAKKTTKKTTTKKTTKKSAKEK